MTTPRPPHQPNGQYSAGYQRTPEEAYAADLSAQAQLAAQARNRRTGRNIIITIVAVLALVIIVGVVNSGGSRNASSVDTATPPAGSGSAPAAVADVGAEAPAQAGPTPAPKPPAPPQVFTGIGDDVVDLAQPIEAGVLVFDCSGCSRNVIVKGSGGGRDDLFVNTIGAYTGSRLITRELTQVEINARGSWTLTVGGIDLARVVAGPAEGSGDEVLVYGLSPAKARLVHTGERNFVVKIVDGSGRIDLAVNEIGAYEGTVPFPGGEVALVEVTADGDWSITPT